jgi:hypothetical protein
MRYKNHFLTALLRQVGETEEHHYITLTILSHVFLIGGRNLRPDYIGDEEQMDKSISIASVGKIEQLIYLIRGNKVILDSDLAQLYGVETRALKQAVRRNRKRFPADFMFELTKEEDNSLRSQNVILKRGKHSKYLPFAFTEQGVAMLSSVLNSERAITVNIEIMRVFVRLREMLATHKELASKFEKLEKCIDVHDEQFQVVFEAIKALMKEEEKPKRKIGFHVEEPKAQYKVKSSLR